MKRHIVTILTVLSLLVCVVALWHWAFSFMDTTRMGWTRGGLALISIDGPEKFVAEQLGEKGSDALRGLRFDMSEQHEFLGFAHARGEWRGCPFWLVIVPYWCIVPLTAILPVRWLLTRRRRRGRVIAGRCAGCGYDLRGSPERCPECGAPAPPTSPARATPLSESAIIGR